MNVSLNSIGQAGIPTLPTEVAANAQTQSTGKTPALTITTADDSLDVSSLGDAEKIEVSQDSLRKDDELGLMVNSAFNLPAQPWIPPSG